MIVKIIAIKSDTNEKKEYDFILYSFNVFSNEDYQGGECTRVVHKFFDDADHTFYIPGTVDEIERQLNPKFHIEGSYFFDRGTAYPKSCITKIEDQKICFIDSGEDKHVELPYFTSGEIALML